MCVFCLVICELELTNILDLWFRPREATNPAVRHVLPLG